MLVGNTLLIAGVCVPGVARGQAVSLPVTPAAGKPSFLAQVAGRAAVADSIYALSKSPFSVSAKWRIVTQDERKRLSERAGSESLTANLQANRVSLTSTINPAPNTPQSVSHFVSDGYALLGTQYTAPLPPKKGAVASRPIRTYFRIPIEGDVATATDALLLAKAGDAPLTRVARAALLAPLENGGYGRPLRGTYARQSDGTVTQTEPAAGNDRRKTTTTRRYRFDARTRFPLSIEEWVTSVNAERNTTRTVYRQETFAFGPMPTRTDVFTTKPAANYVETSPPSGIQLPARPGPDQADTKARALLARWERAWARIASYTARVSVASRVLPQTPESRPIAPQDATQENSLTLYYQRPGRLYIASEPDQKAALPSNDRNRRRVVPVGPQTAVSDGTTLAVYEANRRGGQAAVNGDDALLRAALRRAGFDDRSEALTWILDGPQTLFGDAEFAEYRGALPCPGGRAEAVTIRQTITQDGARRQQRQRGGVRGAAAGAFETTITSTVYFDDKTGLPIRIERFVSTDNQAAIRRDDPPHRFLSADYTAVKINEEASPGIFQLP